MFLNDFFVVGDILVYEKFEGLGIISSEVPPASQFESIENQREIFISKVVDKGGKLDVFFTSWAFYSIVAT